jgi:hypothetical protein
VIAAASGWFATNFVLMALGDSDSTPGLLALLAAVLFALVLLGGRLAQGCTIERKSAVPASILIIAYVLQLVVASALVLPSAGASAGAPVPLALIATVTLTGSTILAARRSGGAGLVALAVVLGCVTVWAATGGG